MISLVVPFCGGNVANFQRTLDSARSVCDETIAISTCLFNDDIEAVRATGARVVELPWNYTYIHGFGAMHNAGTKHAGNNWLILLGVAETIHAGHENIKLTLPRAQTNYIYQCNHQNDPNRWSRCWNRTGGPRWGGIIHETVRGGQEAGVLFEMRDTDKVPSGDALKDEVLKFHKTCLYNHLYQRLLNNNDLLGYTDPGWLAFVNGAKESINAFCESHADLITFALEGDRDGFINRVEERTGAGSTAYGVNYAAQGQPRSNNETIVI